MGTRGFVGFVSGGETKVAYNHFDSYPGGLGITMLDWLSVADFTEAAAQALALRVVDPESTPTPEDVVRLSNHLNLGVDGGHPGDGPSWYQLLRGTQGSPSLMLAAGVVEDASDFPGDSLFAEYGYVADFDAQVFEVYAGFQKEPHTEGRFSAMEPKVKVTGMYYPVRLIGSWPLSNLPSGDDFLAQLRRAEGIEGDDD